MKNLEEYGLKTKNRTFVIAEIGINHGGSLECAKELIDSAVRAGVDAVKFQTYLTEKRAPRGNQEIFDILKKCELPFEAFSELKEYAENKGCIFFSTPFDDESVDYLESINCQLYKVASFDVVNHQLLRRLSKTGKPVIISVGMSNIEEIRNAYRILKQGTDLISILHCISSYPTQEEGANLCSIFDLKNEFDCVIGQSDHTNDIRVPLYAVAAGAQVIEKHYKISDEMECIDSPVSISESKMSELVLEVRQIEKIFGCKTFGIKESERGIVQFRRPTE